MHLPGYEELELASFEEVASREHAERIQSQVPDSDPTAQAVANSLRIRAATANAMAATVEQPPFQSEG